MVLSSGARLGPYEIIDAIGAGGMGEVYRAKDTRLDRTVAIKVLPSHLSSHPGLRQRLEREARAVSSLNHPNICTLHDIGHQEGIDYLVMEYIEGETLAKRLSKGTLPFADLLHYSIQIADALDKAHKQGIIHRDLKPGNIMLTKGGAKLLDFGLAKNALSGTSDPVASGLATASNPLTAQGTVLGTLPYMAPEQLEGKETDARTDIFAFGAVLYEMATGNRAFSGGSQATLIASILAATPPAVSSLNKMLPAEFDRLIQRCLAKDPDDRWQTARDIVLELKSISEIGPQRAVPAIRKIKTGLERVIWATTVLMLAGLLLFFYKQRSPVTSVIRFAVPPPAGSTFDNTIALSPNGRMLVFTANDSTGNNILWLRNIDSSIPRGLQGTEGASFPFWAPDGQSIGYFAEGKLKRFDLDSNASQTICQAPIPRGGTWNRNDVILFSANAGGAIYRVSSKGGNPIIQTSLDQSRGESTIRYPFFLADDRHFLSYIWTNDLKTTGVYAGALDSNQKQWLTRADSGAVYTSGHLLLVSGNRLTAQRFDAQNLKLTGDPVTLAEGVWVSWFTPGFTAFSASQNGTLAYRTGGFQNSEFVWYDRTGKQLAKAGAPGLYAEPCLSPDGKKICFSGTDNVDNLGVDIWILELARGIANRFTAKKDVETCSLWSPDGNHIVYSSITEGGFYEKSLSTGKEMLLFKFSGFALPDDISKDGRFIVYTALELKSNQSDIWILPTNESGKPTPFVSTGYNETNAQMSPDGNWIAYTSDESGRTEVYLQTFPTPGEKSQISTAGGEQPKWRGDSKEIFYIAPDKKVMSVDFRSGSIEQPAPKILFQSRIMPLVEARNHYVVTADGQRFLINTPVEEIATSPIEVILNWPALLK